MIETSKLREPAASSSNRETHRGRSEFRSRPEARDVPADFAKVAPRMSHIALRSHYHAGAQTITRWLVEAGIATKGHAKPFMPVPDGFAALAGTMSNGALSRHFGVSDHTAARWRREVGLPLRFVPQLKPVPPGFEAMATRLPRTQLAKHFSCSVDTIVRWAEETGTTLIQGYRGHNRSYGARNVSVIDTRNDSLASRAQTYLQRFYPVWRCDEQGRFDPKGSHFRCDGVTRTTEEMIERARRKGFDENEWRRAA